MRAALGLAARGLGRVAPNPAVGCVLVKDGIVVGRGWTQPGGRPHAETEALAAAGAAANGAVAYVSLEPCSHTGKTPPCADALIQAGISEVICACEDPDPRVSGNGIRRLLDAGLRVRVGLLAEDAKRLNAGFFRRVTDGRPHVTLKLATTLDGRIALANGDSKWITGDAARRRGHLYRARNDAILTGIGTVNADDPELTCRLAGLEDRSPIRVVVDARGEIRPDAKLFKDADRVPVVIVCAEPAERVLQKSLAGSGAEIVTVAAGADARLDPAAVLAALGERGITRLLLETGAGLSAAFLRAGLVDELAWFRAARVIGGDGLGAVGPLDLAQLADTPAFRPESRVDLGTDVLETFLRA